MQPPGGAVVQPPVNRGGIQAPVNRGGIQTPVNRGGLQTHTGRSGPAVASSRVIDNPAHSAANYQRLKAQYASQSVNGPGKVYAVKYGSTDLSRQAFDYRVSNGLVNSNRNVAVFEYRAADGSLQTVAAPSQWGVGHSEHIVADTLAYRGIQPSQVTRIYTERQPCQLPGARCDRFLRQQFPQAQVTYTVPYEGAVDTPAFRQAVDAYRRSIQR